MRAKELCYVITFYTTADAVAYETYCRDNALPGRLIPVPREISAGCGMAFKIPAQACATDSPQLPDAYRRSGVTIEEAVKLWI